MYLIFGSYFLLLHNILSLNSKSQGILEKSHRNIF
jgi:hypothetical protein